MNKRPNILLIMSDQHNPHILGCAGDPVIRTPNLDRLAANGKRFTSTYCAAPVCVPSRMAFMASRQCSEIAVWSNGHMLDSRIPTFADALAEQGYQTVLCGRMHFRGPDQWHGFEQRLFGDFYDITWEGGGEEPYTVGPVGGMLRGGAFGDLPDQLGVTQREFFGQNKGTVKAAAAGRTAMIAYDEQVTDHACAFLDNQEYDDDRPLAMVVGLFLPHNPLVCPREQFDYYHDRVEVPKIDPDWAANLNPGNYRNRDRYIGLSEAEQRRGRAAYYGLVEVMDEQIGRLLDSLAASPLADDTMVIYTSDHGDMAGEHGLWMKSTFYEGAACVPMIWSWPGQIAAGTVDTRVNSLIDIGPTLADYAGRTEPFASGRSLRPLLQDDQDVDWPDTAICESSSRGCMIRHGRWKLSLYSGVDQPELFDLEADPNECHDLGGDPAYHDLCNRLLEQIRELWHPNRAAEHSQKLDVINQELYTVALDFSKDVSLAWTCRPADNALS